MELVADIPADITPSTPQAPAVTLVWREVDEQFWTAADGGNHAGVVEFAEGRFRVIDAIGMTVGTSHSLGGARDLLAASLDPDFVPAIPASEFSDVEASSPGLTVAHIAALITLTVSTIAALGLGAGLLS